MTKARRALPVLAGAPRAKGTLAARLRAFTYVAAALISPFVQNQSYCATTKLFGNSACSVVAAFSAAVRLAYGPTWTRWKPISGT